MKISNVPDSQITRSIRSLPLKEWSEADRLGWLDACRPGHRLIRGGAASHLAAVTQSDLANRYGLYLDFLNRHGQRDLDAAAGALVAPEFIGAFIAELQARVSSVTVSRTIYKVRRAAQCIAPSRDFAWLAEIGKDLAVLERPKDKFARMVLTERLIEAGLSLIQESETDVDGTAIRRAVRVRDGLMVALNAVCPIRLKNFAALDIGSSFVRIDKAWWITLQDTKSGRPDERPVPPFLTSFIERYLRVFRPILLRDATSGQGSGRTFINNGAAESDDVPTTDMNALWIGRSGAALSYSSVERAIAETTRMTIGMAIYPHMFRVAAATSAALHVAESPNLASALLQHSNEKITEDAYIRANSLSVARDFADLVRRF
jgi:integrase